ncbi:hypothetical protein OH76DRAFT_243965 [Lentinus brumalis]|uniref:Uncharacterized protein n=1 Tax=Lentinus brumalis TaxID=2498619 RepID=A0A371DHU3_9APHY|nr:hypothetical protein OH76DRAFT_243965 [Polyporus brumalis]
MWCGSGSFSTRTSRLLTLPRRMRVADSYDKPRYGLLGPAASQEAGSRSHRARGRDVLLFRKRSRFVWQTIASSRRIGRAWQGWSHNPTHALPANPCKSPSSSINPWRCVPRVRHSPTSALLSSSDTLHADVRATSGAGIVRESLVCRKRPGSGPFMQRERASTATAQAAYAHGAGCRYCVSGGYCQCWREREDPFAFGRRC